MNSHHADTPQSPAATDDAASQWPQPLAGIRVVDFSLVLPGPYCSHLLTEMGAETVKIEPPGGDPARQMNAAGFAAVNRGKQSVCFDPADPQGREAMLRIIETADVLVEGFRPGVMARLGLSFDDVARRNPHILYTSISAYGHTGPYARRPAHDVNIIAAAGYFATTLDADHEHLQRPRLRIADYLSGMFAAFTLAAMLRAPRAERRAQHLDASMFDAMAYVMLPILQTATADELSNPLLRNDVLADVALYRTADGRGVALATLEDKFWAGLVGALGARFPVLAEPGWTNRRGRTQDKLRLATTLRAVFANLSLAEVTALLPEDEVCWSPVLDGAEVLCDPHVLARGLVRNGPHGAGVSSPVVVGGHRAPGDAPAPGLGEHTAQWMQKVGLGPAAPAA